MPKTGYCSVDSNVRLYYELHGTGPRRLVLIMGLNATCDAWDLQTRYFAQLPEFQVCVFDNRGIGRSSAPWGRYTTRLMARDTLRLLEHLGWAVPGGQRSFHVVGISMGGMIAQELALLAASQMHTLTLVATHGGHFAPQIAQVHFVLDVLQGWSAGKQHLWSLPRALVQRTFDVQLDMVLYSMFPPEWLALPADAAAGAAFETNYDLVKFLLVEQAARSPLQTHAGALGQLLAASGHRMGRGAFSRVAAQLPATSSGAPRVLVISGTRDKVISAHHALELAETLHGRLHVFVGAGHGLNIQCADEFNSLLCAHIDSVSGSADSSGVLDDLVKQFCPPPLRARALLEPVLGRAVEKPGDAWLTLQSLRREPFGDVSAVGYR